MDLTYEQVKTLKIKSSDIIAKQNTISEIDRMIHLLTLKPEKGSAYLRSCQLTVGDRKLGLSEAEVPQVLTLLEAAREHVTHKINQTKEEIIQTVFFAEGPYEGTEV